MEKIRDPEHAHILSGLLKCPGCGKSLYGNISKAHYKDKKTRYYYYCKNNMDVIGHKCTFRKNIDQTELDDFMAELEDKLDELMTQLKDLKQQNISGDSIFRFLLHFDELYNKFSDIEKRNFMRTFIDYIDLYPEKQADVKWIRNIVFNFPVPVLGENKTEISLENEMTDECVSLLQRMSNTRERTITLDVEMEDYHRIKNRTEVTADATE